MDRVWKPGTEEPEGDILIMTTGGTYKTGWFERGYYWYGGQYHLPTEVKMWAKIEDILEVTKWLECLESYGLTR